MFLAHKVQENVRAALRDEPRMHFDLSQVKASWEEGVLTLEGEVSGLDLKKLALRQAAGVSGVEGIIDRLRVHPTKAMGDGEICSEVLDELVGDSAFTGIIVRGSTGPQAFFPRGLLDFWIDVRVDDGVVTLDGEVPSLSHKRLAGILAWWVAGTRDVVNGLGVMPEEEDSDAEIADAIRIAFDKDPLVDPVGIGVRVQDGYVTLKNQVGSQLERRAAEADCWRVTGVNDVRNDLAVAEKLPVAA
ncbi:MAG: BON domain-containing protein [Bdellovibrionota bacterium]